MKYIVFHINCRLKTYWFAILRKYFRRSFSSSSSFFLLLFFSIPLLEFKGGMKQWSKTCDDIISSSIFFVSFLCQLLFSPISSTQSVMAFTIRYMAWKNLIQFWVSSHFSDFVCFSTSTSSSSRSFSSLGYVMIIAISVVRLNAPQFFL